MKENLSDEEYIAELEKILSQEKTNEEEEIELSNYDKEIQEQQKEIESLEKEINLLKQNNNISYITNNEINNNFKNILQKKLNYEIELKLNNFLDEYDNNIKGKINQMEENIKKESVKNINEQFNIVLKEIKQNNTKFEDDCIKKQTKIIENINLVNQKLNININNIEEKDLKDLKDSINSLSKKSSKIIDDSNNSKKNLNQYNEDINNNISLKNSSEIEYYESDSNKKVNKFINVEKKDNQKRMKGEGNNLKSNLFKSSGSNSNKQNKVYQNELNNGRNNLINNNKRVNNFQPNLIKKDSNKLNNIHNVKGDNNNEDLYEDTDIKDEDDDNSNNNNIQDSINYFNKSKAENNAGRTKNFKANKKYFDTQKTKNPIIIQNNNISSLNLEKNANSTNDVKNLVPLAQKIDIPINKQKGRRAFNSVQKVFFLDNQQKHINFTKIDDKEKEEIRKEILAEVKEKKELFKNYCKFYIEENILKLFQKLDLNDNQREILKYKIQTILECIGEDKDLYKKDYHPEVYNNTEIDERKSKEAVKKFRKEFEIKEEDYSDEGLIPRLAENGYDIYKTFGKIFGI